MFSCPSVRRALAHLALIALVFGTLQATTGAVVAQGARQFVDRAVSDQSVPVRHNHANVICHTCPGHICFEQHCGFGQASTVDAILGSVLVSVVPWLAQDARAYPPAIGPRSRHLAHYAAQPRAPPLLS